MGGWRGEDEGMMVGAWGGGGRSGGNGESRVCVCEKKSDSLGG